MSQPEKPRIVTMFVTTGLPSICHIQCADMLTYTHVPNITRPSVTATKQKVTIINNELQKKKHGPLYPYRLK